MAVHILLGQLIRKWNEGHDNVDYASILCFQRALNPCSMQGRKNAASIWSLDAFFVPRPDITVMHLLTSRAEFGNQHLGPKTLTHP
jgi:hypothetical protein